MSSITNIQLTKPRRCRVGLLAMVCVLPGLAVAAPGDVLFEDDFNSGLGAWTLMSAGGNAAIGNSAANEGSSLELNGGDIAIVSDAFAASVATAELSLWIRRGHDSFSEDPDPGEDLVVEVRDASGNWIELETFPGNGQPGEIFTPSYTLPVAALHANASVRLHLLGGDGGAYDYWHVDSLRVVEGGSGAVPLGIGTCDDFENGIGNWTIATSQASASAGISSQTANSPTQSLFTEGGVVSVTSNPSDLSGASLVALELWVRRGNNGFSGRPENGEDLIVEYLNASSVWVALETFPGGNPPGEVFLRSYSLPGDAYHAGFRIRFRQTGGSGNSDYWHVDDVCLTGVNPILFSLDETAWTGASGEIVDTNGIAPSGTVFGSAQNDDATPAIAGTLGTCRYGVFDGIDDYVEIPDDATLDLADELTIGAWIYLRSLPSELYTIVSKDTNYEFHIDNQGRVYWWWQVDNFRTNGFAIGLNEWHHVAITYESGNQVIYVDGVARATNSYVGALPQNDLPLFIGTDWNFISRAFDGLIDEVYIAPRSFSAAEVAALMAATHDCPSAGAQFSINHDQYGIHCIAETITVDVVDATAGTPLLSYNAVVQLDTQSGRGTWSLLAGSGSLMDAPADDGIAVYDWPLGESQATFALSYAQGPPLLDIDVFQISDPGITDTDAEGLLEFSPNGFMLTASPLSNPPPGIVVPFDQPQTAALPFAVYLTAYGQTPTDPVCGVIESYTGSKNLEFWSAYVDPASGLRAMEIDGTAVGSSEPTATGIPVMFSNGQASVSARYKDVGEKILLVKDSTTVNADLPNGIRGATAGFVVRPATFDISDIRNAAGSLSNPQAAGPADPVFVRAGELFRATVTALDAEGDPTPNYGQEANAETVRLDTQLIAPVGGAAPAVSAATGFGAFAGGIATGFDFAWPEVGIIRLVPAVGDGDYLGSGDVAGTPSERVGRFVPDHFGIALNTPMFATACSPGNFTYVGEAFDYLLAPRIIATAQAAGGSTTLNYTGQYFKLSTATLANRAYAASQPLDLAGLPPANIDPTVNEIGPGIAELVFDAGTGLRFSRSFPSAPFDADIALAIDVLDADGIAAALNPVVFGASGGMAFSNGTEFRYGRLRLGNAYGSELVNLPIPLLAEYYGSAALGFVPNFADSCTTGIALTLGAFTASLSPGETCALDAGAPGESDIGCAAVAPAAQRFHEPPLAGDFNLTLAAPGQGNSGGVTIFADVPIHLRFDWDSTAAGEENPSGQARFGLYRGESKQIYIREVY